MGHTASDRAAGRFPPPARPRRGMAGGYIKKWRGAGGGEAWTAPAPFWYGLAFLIYGAGAVVCHQLPERSFHAWSAQLPVCARCTGIYAGAALAAIVSAVRPAETMALMLRATSGTSSAAARSTAGFIALATAALPTVASLAYEWTTGDTPSNATRALAGVPLGAAVTFLVMLGLR